ncbi:MAG: universal stress protein [Bacteroidetes bacterium]|nr:universal stress protein [Bacteroidota bacterium]
MKTIKKILIPTDFSEMARNAFRYGIFLADKLGASIKALHVIYPEYEALDLPVMAAQATQKKLEAAREVLKNFIDVNVKNTADRISSEELLIEDGIEIGTPASVIPMIVERDHIDIVVMGTQGEHNMLEKMFGSVSSSVIRKTDCPVIVIPEEANFKDIHTIAYATDLSTEDPYHIWKVAKMLSVFNPVLHCVHVDTGKMEEGQMKMAELKEFFENRDPSLQITFNEVIGDDVTEVLDDFVQTKDVNLLTMFSPHRSMLESFFHKSQTRRMAFQCQVPLLILKGGD